MEHANHNSPNWVKTILVLGATTVIALYLVYWVTRSLDTRIGKLQDTFDQHDRRVHAFLYAICLNNARDRQAYARCAVAVDGKLTTEDREK